MALSSSQKEVERTCHENHAFPSLIANTPPIAASQAVTQHWHMPYSNITTHHSPVTTKPHTALLARRSRHGPRMLRRAGQKAKAGVKVRRRCAGCQLCRALIGWDRVRAETAAGSGIPPRAVSAVGRRAPLKMVDGGEGEGLRRRLTSVADVLRYTSVETFHIFESRWPASQAPRACNVKPAVHYTRLIA